MSTHDDETFAPDNEEACGPDGGASCPNDGRWYGLACCPYDEGACVVSQARRSPTERPSGNYCRNSVDSRNVINLHKSECHMTLLRLRVNIYITRYAYVQLYVLFQQTTH